MRMFTNSSARSLFRLRSLVVGETVPVSEEALAAAQRSAFAQIARQYEGDLLRAARRLCRGHEDQAQDLVQETLIRAYQAFLLERYEERNAMRPWLLRILTNLFLIEYRRRRRWDAGISAEEAEVRGEGRSSAWQAASADTPGVEMLADTLDEPLERALASLPEKLRLCVLLVDVEGLDYKETAKALRIPLGTVRSRLARARLQLHACLLEYARERRRI